MRTITDAGKNAFFKTAERNEVYGMEFRRVVG